jgi:hypothetical protein
MEDGVSADGRSVDDLTINIGEGVVVRPGDVLVIRTHDQAAADALVDRMSPRLAEWGVKALVVAGDIIQLAVMRAEETTGDRATRRRPSTLAGLAEPGEEEWTTP